MTRTTGKGLYKWLKGQKNVRWPETGGGLIVYLNYNDVDCVGLIAKMHSGGKLIQPDLTIRPIQSIHDIGNGAGQAIYKTFSEDANKKTI